MIRRIIAGALVAGLLSAGSVTGDEPPKSLRRLPPVVAPTTAAPADGPRDLVLFAAGAVQIRPPAGWWVRELPFGREVRLVLSPSESRSSKSLPVDGIWMSYHAQGKTQQNAESELLSLIQSRVRLAIGNAAAVKQPSLHRLENWPAVELEFERAEAVQGIRAPAVRGSHILVRTDWGIVEMHVSAPPDVYEHRSQEFERLLTELRLEEPQLRVRAVAPAVLDASDIVGVWKAYRSRLRLSEDGNIEIELDRGRVVPPNGVDRRYEYASMSLVGHFRAENDLLHVVWDDGSKLNFRWKLNGSNLLLTDHEGQISQLQRLYE